MEPEGAIQRFDSLSAKAQLRVLAYFGHSLTIAAREAYDQQEQPVAQRLVNINEILHRVFAHIRALIDDDASRYPDAVLVRIMLGSADAQLGAQLQQALEDALERGAA